MVYFIPYYPLLQKVLKNFPDPNIDMVFFTICSNNYLGQAAVLGRSVLQIHPESKFILLLMDEFSSGVNYNDFPFEIIPAKEIEPNIIDLAKKYDIVELNTCIKPKMFSHLFELGIADRAIYLDPDIMVFNRLTEVEVGLDNANILLTPHIFSPIVFDGKSPQESLFLNYGIYNLGFIAIKQSQESENFLKWWQTWTYNKGYNEPGHGIFVDQLPINYATIFFKGVELINSRGYNMAPWNLHERKLSKVGSDFIVNQKEPLVFYHFSSFRININDLPFHNYSRYTLKERPDLKELTELYNQELLKHSFALYRKIPCYYVNVRNSFMQQERTRIINQKPLIKRIVLFILRQQIIRRISRIISINNQSYDNYYQNRNLN